MIRLFDNCDGHNCETSVARVETVGETILLNEFLTVKFNVAGFVSPQLLDKVTGVIVDTVMPLKSIYNLNIISN